MSSLERKMQRQPEDAPAQPKWTEPEPAPEVFVDGYLSSAVNHGVAKLAFFTLRHDPIRNTNEGRINLRLTMGLPTLIGMHEALGQLIAQMRTTEGA